MKNNTKARVENIILFILTWKALLQQHFKLLHLQFKLQYITILKEVGYDIIIQEYNFSFFELKDMYDYTKITFSPFVTKWV